MKVKTQQFKEVARREMSNERCRLFLSLISPVVAAMRQAVMASFPDPEASQAYGAAIRGEALARLPELLEQFDRNASSHGAKVVWIRNSGEAKAWIQELAQRKGIKYVTKGKSMLSEELGINEALLEQGVEPVETDLGEFIIQLLDRPPFHIVGPAVNIPPEEIRDIFLKKGVMKEPVIDPVQLGYAARKYLRDKFHHLEMGIVGVNMAVAETGTVINVENEGNICFSKSSPRIQVSIMSIEKVVPTMADAMHMLRLLCSNATGQKISAYVSMDTGPKKTDEMDGPEELYILVVDNMRSDIYTDIRTREALRCIRCGACGNVCPVYGQIGGYPYGWAYTGPIGQILNSLLLGLDVTGDLYRACTLCGACRSVCPVGMDHPKLLRYYRAMDVEANARFHGKGRPGHEKMLMDLWTVGASRGWRWRTGAKQIRRILNWESKDGYISRFGGELEAWFRCRDLPAMAKKTFHERWKAMSE